MTEDTDNFLLKVKEQHFWKFYEIKICLFRPDINSDWLAIFVYVGLLVDKVDIMKNLPSTDHFSLIHQVDEIHKLDQLLNQIRDKEVKLRDIRVSLRLMTTRPNYEFYPKSYGLFGINEPSYGLNLTGKYSQEFEEVRRKIELELQRLPLPFDNIIDAVHSLLGLGFWNFSYSPFVLIFAPIPIKITDVKFTQERLAIILSCSKDTELEHLRLNLYPKDLQGKQFAQKPITAFTRYKNTEKVTHSHTVTGKAAVYLKIVLLYENEPIEEKIAEKTLDHPAKPVRNKKRRVSRSNKKFDAFVSYHELTGKYFAESTKKCLEDNRIRTFVAHMERPTLSGDFEQVINAAILCCRFFILLISVHTLERPEVIREIRTAYPEGLKNGPKLFVFRQNHVKRRSNYFMEQTRIDIGRQNQQDFRDDAELASRILILLDDGEFRV